MHRFTHQAAMQFCTILLAVLPIGIGQRIDYVQPEQIHISYGGDASTLFITWVTFDNRTTAWVEYGRGRIDTQASGTVTKFVDGGTEKRELFIHRVTLVNLKPNNKTYVYHVGCNFGWSAIYYFTTPPAGPNWSPKFAVFGDLGVENSQSMARLQQDTQKGYYNMLLHVGDFAYNFFENNGRTGDQFMRMAEPMAAYVPYMPVVGNHEYAYNFSNYVNRFTVPENGYKDLVYSFDYGPAHFIAFSTEFYFWLEYGWLQIANQFAWLEADLQRANANRQNVPWIIVMGHRPMYCSNLDRDDCTQFESIVRGGLPHLNHAYSLEILFHKYTVDLMLFAHEHSYERLWPVYNRTVFNGTAEPYTNPCAPVHVITGAAGNREGIDRFIRQPGPFSAFRLSEYSFGRMQIFNATHLYYEQILNQNGSVIDSMWLKKSKHKSYKRRECRGKGIHFPLAEKPDFGVNADL